MRDLLARAQDDLQGLTVKQLQTVERYKKLRTDMLARIQSAIGDDDLHTYRRSALAEIFNVNERTITRWSKQGHLPQSDRGKWDIRLLVKCLHDQLEGRGDSDTAEESYRRAKARREQLRLERELGSLVTRDTVLRIIAPTLTALKANITGLKDALLRYIPADQRPDAAGEMESRIINCLGQIEKAFLTAAEGEESREGAA